MVLAWRRSSHAFWISAIRQTHLSDHIRARSALRSHDRSDSVAGTTYAGSGPQSLPHPRIRAAADGLRQPRRGTCPDLMGMDLRRGAWRLGARGHPAPRSRRLDARPHGRPFRMNATPHVVQITRIWATHLLDEREPPVLIEWQLDAGVWPPARPVLKSWEHGVSVNKGTPRIGDNHWPAAVRWSGGGASVHQKLREPVPFKSLDPDLGGGRCRTRRWKSTGHDV